MAKPPVSGHNNTTSEHLQSIGLQTWILRVYIHCEGCKKKVFKVLQSIDGVYKTLIDAKEHKATVTGSVNGEILVQKLLKSGKHAEILPESFTATAAAADNASGHSNSKKKKKQSNKQLQNDVVTTADDAEHVNEEKNESKGACTGGNVEKIAVPAVAGGEGGGNGNGNETGGGKKKKNKKKKVGDNHVQPNGETDGLPAETAENATACMEQLNLGTQMPQMVYSTPYNITPYQSYYPTPAYGVSYSTSYPSAESSYYMPPVYGYAQSHPSGFYPPPPSNNRRSAFDDYDGEGGEGRVCAIM